LRETNVTRVATLFAIVVLLGMVFVACGTTRAGTDLVPVLATGEWMALTDGEDGGSSSNEMAKIEICGAPAWHFAGEVTTLFERGFAVMRFEPDEVTVANLGGTEAISFMVLGDGQRYAMRLHTDNVADRGYFEFAFATLAGEAARVAVPLRLFAQPPWADSVGPLRRDLLTAISWQTHESWRPGTFEITLWDLRLYVSGKAVTDAAL